MDGSIVFITTGIIGGIFMWGVLSHHMTFAGKIAMFWVCYVGTCFFIAAYTGQDLNSVLLAPLTLLTPAQNQTIMAQAGNISVGNATATFQSGNATYTVTNSSVQASGTAWLNGTIADPASPMNPLTALMSALLLPFQSPWGLIVELFIFTTFAYFFYTWVRGPMRRREDYDNYDSPSRQTTPRPPDSPEAQPRQPQTKGTEEKAESEEKKPEKRDRYEVIKV